MTVTEALKAIRNVHSEAAPYRVGLVCGFTPLHLQTFLAAHLQQALPARRVEISTGLYGDLAGTLERARAAEDLDGLAIALEWPDLDPRLGFRSPAAVPASSIPDILSQVRSMLERIAAAILRRPAGLRIALSLPTISLPPLFHPPGWQASEPELLLERQLLDFAAAVAGRAAIVNSRRLAEDSPPRARLDLKSDLLAGLPYSVSHADVLASALARLMLPPTPKKGIVTDLDNTVWRGIVGEVGPQNVTWDLASHSQLHGLYQKLLASLAEQGVLIGIASKNDPEVVARTLERRDLLLRPDRIFPVEVHWSAKSGSVQRILETWNIAADSVVFVDDSRMELAEVAAAHPGIECLLFPENDYAAGLQMLWRLRDLFGREHVSKDDALRLDSIRQASAFREGIENHDTSEEFLADANAVVAFDFAAGDNPRTLELVNKTNQFNLNGIRYTESDWRRHVSAPGAVLIAVAYEDKFGPLGTIAVILGELHGRDLNIAGWVMSCRAFSRRIEHQCLRRLFDHYSIDRVRLNFSPTPKNGPTRDFCRGILGAPPDAPFSIAREQFDAACPALYHRIEILEGSQVHG